jgi:hypothetical protein
MKKNIRAGVLFILFTVLWALLASADDSAKKEAYEGGKLKAIDSELKVKVGEVAPDFTLKSITGKSVTLSEFREKNNVVISFIPAAWAAICSDQWPGYNIAQEVFQRNDAVILGISVDNIPRWTAYGFLSSRISGPMERLQASTAYCVRMGSRKGQYSSSIKRARSAI